MKEMEDENTVTCHWSNQESWIDDIEYPEGCNDAECAEGVQECFTFSNVNPYGLIPDTEMFDEKVVLETSWEEDLWRYEGMSQFGVIPSGSMLDQVSSLNVNPDCQIPDTMFNDEVLLETSWVKDLWMDVGQTQFAVKPSVFMEDQENTYDSVYSIDNMLTETSYNNKEIDEEAFLQTFIGKENDLWIAAGPSQFIVNALVVMIGLENNYESVYHIENKSRPHSDIKKYKAKYSLPKEASSDIKERKIYPTGTQRKVALIENNNNDKGKLIEQRHKTSNDIEINPGPTIRILKELENFIKQEHSHQVQFKNKIFQIIRDLYEDATNRKIPKKLYTEENLNTIQEIFNLSIKNNYESDIMEKIEYLRSNFYDTVREEENREGTVKKRVQERGVEIVTFFGGLKRDIGTQFPERHLLMFEEESEATSTKENDQPIPVNQHPSCNLKKRKTESDTDTEKRAKLRMKFPQKLP